MTVPAIPAAPVVEAVEAVEAMEAIAAFPPRIVCGGRERLGEEGGEERYGIQIERGRRCSRGRLRRIMRSLLFSGASGSPEGRGW